MEQILVWLTPLVVALATTIVKLFKSAPIPGWVITAVLVPAFSGLYTWLIQTMIPDTPHWYFQFLLGLIATFIYELKKQLSQQ